MNYINKIGFLFISMVIFGGLSTQSQEINNNLNTSTTYHNQLFFNRFLINPTFSLVRENKSYLNILHRNQYATFADNIQNYYLGFGNKLTDKTAIGIGVYSQWAGVVQEFGFNANYATAVKLGEKSQLAFGVNISYFNRGLDQNRIVVAQNDPEILDSRKEINIAVQPGVNLSIGNFDFGLYAKDMLRYNQTTNELFANLSTKSINASVQYTHNVKSGTGFFQNARLMPLGQIGKNVDGSMYYLGSLLLDLPKYGWLQTTVDQEYGVAGGIGFYLGEKMSLGYVMEKDVFSHKSNLGWNHEVSLGYQFKDDDLAISVADRSSDDKIDRIVRNYEEQIADLITERDKALKNNNTNSNLETASPATGDANSIAYENRLLLDELILRQDSIENARTKAFEQRFETIVRFLRNDIKDNIKNNLPKIDQAKQTTLIANKTKQEQETAEVQVDGKFKKLPLRVFGQGDLVGAKSGYYVIANVYKNKTYLNAFIEKLKKKGLNPKQFYNKKNRLYYVYLADYDYKRDAQTAYVSNMNGKYNADKWIMKVDQGKTRVSNTFEDEPYSRDQQ